MKRTILFIFALSLHAATYYVSSAGNDSNNGSSGSPWLTVAHAVASMGCGDTLNVVANGSGVTGDAALPYFSNCTSTTTIQSSKWNLFAPTGYRTNPTVDGPNYGKITLSSAGISATSLAEAHGGGGGGIFTAGSGFQCVVTAIDMDGTIHPYCGSGVPIPDLANDDQLEFELNQEGTALQTMPVNLPFMTKVYVESLSAGTFKVSLTKGGSPITGMTCSSPCVITDVLIGFPFQVDATTSTFTNPQPVAGALSGNYANGVGISLSAAGQQLFGTIPAPLQLNTEYYICHFNSGAQSFKLCSDVAGAHTITLTNVGSGPLVISGNQIPSNWAFRGVEIVADNLGLNNFLSIGMGWEASSLLGSASHFEVDHSYIHQKDALTPVTKGIYDNGRFVNIHDSWISGFTYMEAQAITWCGSIGPTAITNNFLEADGENTIGGGCGNTSGVANSNKLFTGNYYFKPPSWKITLNGTGNTHVPSGPCWYSADDPAIPGGEWYKDTPMSQWYQCGPDSLWHTTMSTPYNCSGGTDVCGSPLFKDLAEHKNGRYFTYIGNVFNYIWVQGQNGEFFNNSAEPGSGPGMADDHIYIQNNAAFNGYLPFVRVNFCNGNLNPLVPCVTPGGDHFTTGNLFSTTPEACGITTMDLDLVGCPLSGSFAPTSMNMISFVSTVVDVFSHNTIWAPDTGFQTATTPAVAFTQATTGCSPSALVQNVTHTNNILFGDYWGDCSGTTTPNIIGAYYGTSYFAYNGMKKGTSSGYTTNGTNTFDKAHMAFPADNTVIKYANASINSINPLDFCLASNSPYSAANGSATLLSTDGTDLGADCQMVAMMTSGARLGRPNTDVQARLFYDVGSTSVVIRYTAQNSGACTATIYNAPARISANQVASVADSAASSVQNGIDRNLLVTGLTAETMYYPILNGAGCPNPIVGIGNGVASFTTKAAGSGTANFPIRWPQATAMRYSADPTFVTGTTNLSAATTQPIPVPHGTPIYAQAGTGGLTTVLIVP